MTKNKHMRSYKLMEIWKVQKKYLSVVAAIVLLFNCACPLQSALADDKTGIIEVVVSNY